MVPFQRDEQFDPTARCLLGACVRADPDSDSTEADSGSAGSGNRSCHNTRSRFAARHDSGLIAESF